ncbi:hypothetical protein, partial [Okeania sp.]|uniref:hypothetical protein n=1 Tax=Okeania sp. TaxID=3100323 RepID=UPI002B4B261C
CVTKITNTILVFMRSSYLQFKHPASYSLEGCVTKITNTILVFMRSSYLQFKHPASYSLEGCVTKIINSTFEDSEVKLFAV